MSSNYERCVELKAGKPFSSDAQHLLQLLKHHQPNFEQWLKETFLPSLDPHMLLRSDWNDTDRNVINTAYSEFRRTPLFKTFDFSRVRTIPNPEPAFITAPNL